jgi:hypothetical protein
MKYWQIVLLIRGYRRRNVLQYQLQRLQAYGASFAFQGDKKNLGPDGWYPLYFDNYIDYNESPVSDEDKEDLLADIKAANNQKQKEQ